MLLQYFIKIITWQTPKHFSNMKIPEWLSRAQTKRFRFIPGYTAQAIYLFKIQHGADMGNTWLKSNYSNRIDMKFFTLVIVIYTTLLVDATHKTKPLFSERVSGNKSTSEDRSESASSDCSLDQDRDPYNFPSSLSSTIYILSFILLSLSSFFISL